eukprot:gb/GECG01016387.1/.p1 GENE.gb/GECG01016387.1/~~gb/GECG01016387.1/.p1  ORF type:complete len:205 (+),score=27.80 gb/GECG01016387.1/:1-615(+)
MASQAPYGQGRQTQTHKLVLLGDMGTGKSSIVDRFCRNCFKEKTDPTIGAAFSQRSVSVESMTVKFEIWDTAGQERYKSLAPMYYRGAEAVVVVYQIQSMESFNNAKQWVSRLEQDAGRESGRTPVIALAGNKCDLPGERQVSREQAEEYADSKGLIFRETSAKKDINVELIFEEIARKMPTKEPQRSALVDISQQQGGSSCCK